MVRDERYDIESVNDIDSVRFCGAVFDISVNDTDSVRFIGAVFDIESVNDVRFCGTSVIETESVNDTDSVRFCGAVFDIEIKIHRFC